jgi:hypothetical protein
MTMGGFAAYVDKPSLRARAKQSMEHREKWIASSLTLLAMTQLIEIHLRDLAAHVPEVLI